MYEAEIRSGETYRVHIPRREDPLRLLTRDPARAEVDSGLAQLAQARASLVEGYGCWRRALEDVENLWALAAWRSTAAEEASEHPAPLAA